VCCAALVTAADFLSNERSIFWKAMAMPPDRDAPYTVAVTGHRPNRVPADQWPRLTRQLGKVMKELEAAHSGRRFALLSGLAEGADRLAADAALARGWALIAMLPFSRARYMEDFPEPAAQAEFDALLARAETVHEAPAADAYTDIAQPYAELGDRLLAAADALLVIWDGAPSQGRGGTVDVMDRARAKAIPPPQWLGTIKQQHM
jgi:hypothetical protein